jgi:hypothetical protein
VCAEIDGNAQHCARLVDKLRETYQDLLVDRHGFLLIPEKLWDEIQHLARRHECELRFIGKSREAA